MVVDTSCYINKPKMNLNLIVILKLSGRCSRSFCLTLTSKDKPQAHIHTQTWTVGLIVILSRASGVAFCFLVKLFFVSCGRDEGFPSGKHSVEARRHHWHGAHTDCRDIHSIQVIKRRPSSLSGCLSVKPAVLSLY